MSVTYIFYLEPAHVEKVLHESEDGKHVEIGSTETTLYAAASDKACDQVDVDRHRYNLVKRCNYATN